MLLNWWQQRMGSPPLSSVKQMAQLHGELVLQVILALISDPVGTHTRARSQQGKKYPQGQCPSSSCSKQSCNNLTQHVPTT